MPRPRASVPPEAIRIEDEVWQNAFARREPARPRELAGPPEPARPRPEPARPRPERRLHAVDGGRARTASPRPQTVSPRPQPEALKPPVNGGVPGRRTVTIRGYGAERNLPWPDGSSRRPQRRVHERAGFKPDRVAMWAVMLGIVLVIVAVASPH